MRGNACKKALAWKALPWSFNMCYKTQTARIRGPKFRCYRLSVWAPQAGRGECRGKAFQAIISLLFPAEGYAALAPGYLHRQADVYCLPGKA